MDRLFEPVETFFEERFRKYADGNVVITESLKFRAQELGLTRKPLIRLPYGADVERVKIRDKYDARARLRIKKGERLLGYVGTIFPSDADLLCKAFQLVSSKCSNTKLAIIGNSRFKFQDKAIRHEKVIKTGKIDFEQLLDWIAACDIMLLPLRRTIANNGRWPSKVCDYLAAGKPVVSTNVSDVALLFEKRVGGCLTNDTPSDFAEGILKMLSLDEPELLAHSIAARKIAENKLSWSKLTDQGGNILPKNDIDESVGPL